MPGHWGRPSRPSRIERNGIPQSRNIGSIPTTSQYRDRNIYESS